MIRRREFIALGLVLAAPRAATAQERSRVARIGILNLVNPPTMPWFAAFRERLQELGWVERKNLVIDFRTAEGKAERLPDLAAELVGRKVDLITAGGSEVTLRAARRATGSIPIVAVAIDYDPVARGYVATLARPGGNITGLSANQLELTAKRLDLLKQAFPKISRIAVLWDAMAADQLTSAEAAAPSLAMQLQPLELRDFPYDFSNAFQKARRARAEALLVLMSPGFVPGRAQLFRLAIENRLPTMTGLRDFADVGGLMSYGPSLPAMFRRAAEQVDRILRGAKPADLPVEQPTQFELVLNLKTAKALGLTIPPSLLVRVDEVIK